MNEAPATDSSPKSQTPPDFTLKAPTSAGFKGHIKPCTHVQAAEKALDDPDSQIPVAPLARMLLALTA